MKLLVVTYPNDLGSRTIEANLCRFLEPVCDMRHFRFAAHDSESIDHKIDQRRNLWRRIQDTLKLRRAVRAAVKDGRKILFYNVSPALFSVGSWRGGEIYITLDWARKLFSPKLTRLAVITSWINQQILRQCKGILPMTEAMATCLIRDYGIPSERVHQVPSLFDVDYFAPQNIESFRDLRVLFVGGDTQRKGGDILYHAFQAYLHESCTLTMVTNTDFPPMKNFCLRKGIRYGTSEHLHLMQSHDIFILPTKLDAGPQVIGEAASAGLAVLTTRSALGAPHVVINGFNGFISETPQDCIDVLTKILGDPEKVMTMRLNSLIHMRKNFSAEKIASSYCAAMGIN